MYGSSKALDLPHRSACPPALRRVRRAVSHRTGKPPAYGEGSHLHLPGALDLVNHDAVDLAGLDVGQQAAQTRTIHVASRIAAVVVVFRLAGPTLRPLAFYVPPAGVALALPRAKLLRQPLPGR